MQAAMAVNDLGYAMFMSECDDVLDCVGHQSKLLIKTLTNELPSLNMALVYRDQQMHPESLRFIEFCQDTIALNS